MPNKFRDWSLEPLIRERKLPTPGRDRSEGELPNANQIVYDLLRDMSSPMDMVSEAALGGVGPAFRGLKGLIKGGRAARQAPQSSAMPDNWSMGRDELNRLNNIELATGPSLEDMIRLEDNPILKARISGRKAFLNEDQQDRINNLSNLTYRELEDLRTRGSGLDQELIPLKDAITKEQRQRRNRAEWTPQDRKTGFKVLNSDW